MLLTLSTTHSPASDLGYLLAKHPDRAQSFNLTFGQAHVFYPESSDERCTFALMLDVDPIGLVRGRSRETSSVFQYVNDRPYVASSFLSVALSKVLGSALNGRCRERPDLVQCPLPLEARLAAVPCRGGEALLRQLFEPLGYIVEAARHPLDERFPEWGEGPYYDVRLRADVRLSDLLGHLYVLVPVLDDAKHYWVGEDEIDKLLARGAEWLPSHPAAEQITHRYLKRHRPLTRAALARLSDEAEPEPRTDDPAQAAREQNLEQNIRLNDQRMAQVAGVLREAGACSVVDLGCGEGRLLRELLQSPPVGGRAFERLVGMDVSARRLEICAARLRLESMPPLQRERIDLIQGSLTYRDARLAGFDAATLIEVIEHLDPDRLTALETVVFEAARPRTLVVTTPNAEYNALFSSLPAGEYRHADHRFEWTRKQFTAWCAPLAEAHGYTVRYQPVGPEDPDCGAPTQMAVFSR